MAGEPIDLAGVFNFGDVLGTGAIFLGLTLLFGGVIVLALIAFAAYTAYNRRVKFNIPVHIWYQERGTKSPVYRRDRGGVFTHPKTNYKRFFLLKNNVGLNPDNIPFNFGENGKKIVHLLQTGNKQFTYLNIGFSDNPGFHMIPGDAVLDWALHSYSAWRERLHQQSFMEKYGHMVLWAFTIIASLFLFFFIAQKFDVLGDVAAKLVTASENVRVGALGTIVE